MGWTTQIGSKRRDIIRYWTGEVGVPGGASAWGENYNVLARYTSGNILWLVVEFVKDCNKPGEDKHYLKPGARFIACIKMGRDRDGWGYKDMSVSEHGYPFYYTCPLKFLDMVPPENETWRSQVREFHAAGKRLKIGDRFTIPGCKQTGLFELLSTHPLRAQYETGAIFKVPKAMVAKAMLV